MPKEPNPAVELCLTKAEENCQRALASPDEQSRDTYEVVAKAWRRLARSHGEADDFDDR